jgi:hypothetical protein
VNKLLKKPVLCVTDLINILVYYLRTLLFAKIICRRWEMN